MSIRVLAIELYRVKNTLEKLEKKFQAASEEEKQRMLSDLNETRREYQTIKKMFDAKKENGLDARNKNSFYRR